MIVDELGRLAGKPIDADHLARAKAAWKAELDESLANDGELVDLLALPPDRGTVGLLVEMRATVAALTPADVERVGKKYLAPTRLVVVEVGPRK